MSEEKRKAFNEDFNMSDYVSVIDFIEVTGFDLTEEEITEEQLKMTIDIIGEMIKNYATIPFLRTKQKEKIQGNSTGKLFLRYVPENILSIKEIREDNNSNNLSLSNIWCNKEGKILQYSTGYFYTDYWYEVIYMSGPVELPKQVKYAVILATKDYLDTGEYQNFTGIKIGDIQLNIKELDTFSDKVKNLLSPWVEGPGVC
jgi:hypothetical protein